jgi:guanyl-specific ribonuclease Sa
MAARAAAAGAVMTTKAVMTARITIGTKVATVATRAAKEKTKEACREEEKGVGFSHPPCRSEALACSAVQYLSFLFSGGGVNVVDDGVGGGDGDGALHGRWRG